MAFLIIQAVREKVRCPRGDGAWQYQRATCGPSSEGDQKEVLLLGVNFQSPSVRGETMAGLFGRVWNHGGTELPKTSKRQRGRDAYFSFSNTFQPPISAPTVGTQLAQEPRTCSQQQTAWLHTAARGQRGRVDLRAESSRPTCGCIPLTRKNTKKPDHGHLPKSCSQPGFIINEAKILLYSSFI